MKVLDPALGADVLFENRPQRLLGLVRLKGSDFGLEIIANIYAGTLRRESNRWTARNRNSGSGVVQLCGSMGSNSVFELIGVAVRTPRPVKRQPREDSRHGMVGMASNPSLRTEGQHHVRTKAPHLERQLI